MFPLAQEGGSSTGFTLMELLMVVAVIAILAAIVIVAINPTRQLGGARDTKRRAEVNAILNAVSQYAIDHDGLFPCAPAGSPCVDNTWRMLGAQSSGCNEDTLCGVTGIASSCLLLRSLSGTYLTTVPADPRYGSGDALGPNTKSLYIVRTENDRLTVKACRSEVSEISTVSR